MASLYILVADIKEVCPAGQGAFAILGIKAKDHVGHMWFDLIIDCTEHDCCNLLEYVCSTRRNQTIREYV